MNERETMATKNGFGVLTSPVERIDVFVHLASDQRVHGIVIDGDDGDERRAQLNRFPTRQIQRDHTEDERCQTEHEG